MQTMPEVKQVLVETPEIPTILKCACAHCGEIIEFFASRAGQTVQCPQCREKSQLPEPEKLAMVEVQGPPLPTTKLCPVCGAEMKFLEKHCVHCEALRRRQILRFRLTGAAALIVVAGGISYALLRGHEASHAVATIAVAKPVVSVLPQPVVTRPKSINDLKPGQFTLEQGRGSDLVMAVGDILNDSGNAHYALRADVELLDENGTKIGTATDYSAQLGPNQTWHFVAQVKDANVKSVRFASIKEGQ